MQEDQDLSLWTQGPHKNLTTSRPSNSSNGIHHQHIKEFTQLSHINHPTTNQEIKTNTSITTNTKTSNQTPFRIIALEINVINLFSFTLVMANSANNYTLKSVSLTPGCTEKNAHTTSKIINPLLF